MANLREISRRMSSIKSTMQITRTMEMISTARIQKALTRAQEALPYKDAITNMLANVAGASLDESQPLLQGRDFVIPDDIQRVSHAVLSHRLLLTAEAEMGGYTTASVLSQIMQQIQVPQ